MILKNKRFKIYTIIYTVCFIGTVLFFYFFFDVRGEIGITEIKQNSVEKALEIVFNNMKNFIQYFLCFPLWPLFFLADLFFTTWTIAMSVHINGAIDTLSNLFPHGLLEFPNMILYSGLSFIHFRNLIKSRSFSFDLFFNKVKEYRRYYLISFLCVIIAGMIEGLIT